MATVAFAFLAGVLSILSPCVLPLVPVVLGAAASQGRAGPVALSAGLALSFTAIGLFVATIGFSIGLDTGVFRLAAAVILVAVGGLLLVPAFAMRFAVVAGPIGSWAESRFGGFSTDGWLGQLGVGLLLGAVWSPCVGPTLGAASVAAAQLANLPAVAVSMLAFGIGAGLPLLLLGLMSREAHLRWRDRLRGAGGVLKPAMGAMLILIGVAILTGVDKRIETLLVDASPDWLTTLTTRF